MTVLNTRDHSGEWLTVAEVAERLRCSEPTVRRRIRASELRHGTSGTSSASTLGLRRLS
jgi:excisionase family DNA binding protein